MKPNTNPYLLAANGVTVDITMLYDVSPNDEAYRKLMADTFLKTVPVTLQNIQSSFDAEDFDALYQAAHKTKSTISIIKINNMLEWMKEIEQLAKQRIKNDALAQLIGKVKERFEIAQNILSNQFYTQQGTTM